MKQISFSISYDGPALADGTMDVFDLAPALVSVGELFNEANVILNGDQTTFKTSMKAISKGSFQIELALSQTALEHIVALFAWDGITAAKNIGSLIFGEFGLIRFWKWLRGKTPDKVESDGDKIIVTSGDKTFEVPEKAYKLHESITIHIIMDKMIWSPIEKEGIDTFKSDYDDHQITIDENESEFIGTAASEKGEVIEKQYQARLSIVTVNFREGNKWRLSEDGFIIFATIEDEEFVREINLGRKSFSKGDVLVCDIKKTQIITQSKVKTEHVIERVVQHIQVGKQLDIEDDPDEAD